MANHTARMAIPLRLHSISIRARRGVGARAAGLLGLRVGLLGLTGCLLPISEVLREAPEATTPLTLVEPDARHEALAADWLPSEGRLDAETRGRHAVGASGWVEVLREDFARASSAAVPGWNMVSFPSIRSLVLEGLGAIELRGPPDMKEVCGLERELDAARLAGRHIRLDVRLTCRSASRDEALKGVNLSLLATDTAGSTGLVSLPLEAGVSPGWEWRRYWLRCRPDLRRVKLSVLAERPGAMITLAEIRVYAADVPVVGAPSTAPAPEAAPPLANLINDGNFETGGAAFLVGGTGRWPNGDTLSLPVNWRFAGEAAVGSQAVVLDVLAVSAGLVFGPLDLAEGRAAGAQEPAEWFLTFHSRSARPTVLTVTLRTAGRTVGQSSYPLTSTWQQYTGRFAARVSTFGERVELAAAELVFSFAGDGEAEANSCWLDAVSLTDRPIALEYLGASPVELGLVGPNREPQDLSHLVDEGEEVRFTVRLVADGSLVRAAMLAGGATAGAEASRGQLAGPVGQLAVDVVDAWDRVVATRTGPAVLPENGVLTEGISAKLPRGYYRVLATLWSGGPGESAIIAQGTLPLAVISMFDPVPLGNRFGLTAAGLNVSRFTTHLGAGWLRVQMSAGRLGRGVQDWDFAAWQVFMQVCDQTGVQAMAGLDLPRQVESRPRFVERWLASSEAHPLGLSVRPGDGGALNGLDWVGEILARQAPACRMAYDLSGSGSLPAAGGPATEPGAIWGISRRWEAVPEEAESYLERVGRHRPAETMVWDLGVPVDLGGQPARRWLSLLPERSGEAGASPDLLTLLREPEDPVRSAARLVRSLLIRTLAGAQMICSEAVALDPPQSIYEDGSRRLHEPDLSPRPALVAFDLLAELLNDATLQRWIDVEGGSRVLYFEKDNGGAVAAFWRPFGLAPTLLELLHVPSTIQTLDCLGGVEPARFAGSYRVLEANEIVRYLVAGPEQREILRQAMSTVRAALGPAGSP